MVPNFFKSSLAIIWLQESLTCSCSSVSFSLCYAPWVDKMFFSLGYRLRSRVALGIGKVVIMYCKFLMEYVYKKNYKLKSIGLFSLRVDPSYQKKKGSKAQRAKACCHCPINYPNPLFKLFVKCV